MKTLYVGNWTRFQWSSYGCAMTTSPSTRSAVLRSLMFLVSSGKRPSVRSLAEQTGLGLGRVADCLAELHRDGFVELRTLRLTFAGLAVAVAAGGQAGGRSAAVSAA